MKLLLDEAKKVLQPLGYEKLGSRFFSIEDGVFRQIDFQRGAHGRYFFVNLCIHPLGLPELLAGKLVVPERPLEYECIIRRRIEQALKESPTAGLWFGKGLMPLDDQVAIAQFVPSLIEAQKWLVEWGSFETILNAADPELQSMITVTPVLWEKACAMLRCFCAFKNRKEADARRHLRDFLAAPTAGYDFSEVDQYMTSTCHQEKH